jgi:hypothetical protein
VKVVRITRPVRTREVLWPQGRMDECPGTKRALEFVQRMCRRRSVLGLALVLRLSEAHSKGGPTPLTLYDQRSQSSLLARLCTTKFGCAESTRTHGSWPERAPFDRARPPVRRSFGPRSRGHRRQSPMQRAAEAGKGRHAPLRHRQNENLASDRSSPPRAVAAGHLTLTVTAYMRSSVIC